VIHGVPQNAPAAFANCAGDASACFDCFVPLTGRLEVCTRLLAVSLHFLNDHHLVLLTSVAGGIYSRTAVFCV
jgi:hypothetical protein